MDYELCSAQLRDAKEQRECSRAQAERLLEELTQRETTLKKREVGRSSIYLSVSLWDYGSSCMIKSYHKRISLRPLFNSG